MKGVFDMRRKKDNADLSSLRNIFEGSQVPDKLLPESIKEMLDLKGYKKPVRNIRRIAVSCTAAAAAVALAVGVVKYTGRDELSPGASRQYAAQNISTMHFAADYGEVLDYISNINERYSNIIEYGAEVQGEDTDGITITNDMGGMDMQENDTIGSVSEDGGTALTGEYTEVREYSDTFNQEEGVLEADIVKTDGKSIFYAASGQLFAVDVRDGRFENSRRLEYTKPASGNESNSDPIGTVRDLYLFNDKLIVISDIYERDDSSGYKGYVKTGVLICDKQTLEIKERYAQEGSYTDVRLRDDGSMYLISNDYSSMYGIDQTIGREETEKYIPSFEVNGNKQTVSCDDILLPVDDEDDKDGEYYYYPQISFINISALDLDSDTPCSPTDTKSIVGTGYTVYCSYDNLYVLGGYDENTDITRLALTEGRVVPRAGTSVKGYVKDQFSMSEYNNYFRIAATYDTYDIGGISGADLNNVLYILDMDLNEVGRVSNFGLNEGIKSVSFNGDMAYVVTFRNTDPLYAIDISDPKAPHVTDELKVTGYSGYMQKWDEGVLLGFGENGNEDGELYGIKLSMFDNSDPNNLKLIDSAVITGDGDNEYSDPAIAYSGRYVYSPALNNRKALLILPEKNLIAIPYNIEDVTVYSSDTHRKDTNEYYFTSGYRFYSFEGGRLHELGDINEVSDMNGSQFERCVMIGDYLYMLSDREFISADMSTFNRTDSLLLPQTAPAYQDHIYEDQY